MKGDIGILSDDLFADLFPHLQDGKCLSVSKKESERVYQKPKALCTLPYLGLMRI